MSQRARRTVPLHPFLLATVPVLVLYASNLKEAVPIRDVLDPLGVILAVTVAVFLVAALILRRSFLRAGLVVSVLLVLFFSFGQVQSALASVPVLGSTAFLLAVWGALAVAGVVAAVRARPPRVASVTRGVNVVAVGLVLVNLASIGLYRFQTRGEPAVTSDIANFKPGSTSNVAGRPDVYYIVLDDYGGRRAMSDSLGYDNTPFLNWLRSKGFYVPTHPSTNYPRTAHSLAASLNMQYVQRLVGGDPGADYGPIYDLIKNDAVPRLFKEKGYTYVHMGSWWTPTTTNPQADVEIRLKGALSEFSQTLLKTTVLDTVQDVLGGSFNFKKREYIRVLFEFDQLDKMRTVPGPKFVFAHILIPHGPYVFASTGAYVDDDERAQRTQAENYVNQVQYANLRAEQVITRLLSGPPATRPVIVLQSDEGYFTGLTEGLLATDQDLEQHFGILSAYYFPHLADTHLYPTITPVNSFRLLFDDYFHAGFGLLPDRNYVFRDPTHVYEFIDDTGRVRPLT